MRLIRTVGDIGISVRNDEGTEALRIFRDKEEFMKKGQTAAAILLLSLALNGCGGGNGTTAFAPTETSLYVTKEGTVTSADVETYENDYYSADELKAYAEEMLGVFESGNQSGSSEKKAEIAECTVKDGTAKLLIKFPDPEEYLRFAKEYPDTESGIRIESGRRSGKGLYRRIHVLQSGRREHRGLRCRYNKTEKALCGMREGQRKDPDRRTGPVCV